MRAGALRHRITIEKLTTSDDGWGGTIETWATHKPMWAEVQYLSGREYWQAQQANSEAQGRVRIRHRDDLDPTMRVNYGGKILHILAPITYDRKNREMHLLFKEALD